MEYKTIKVRLWSKGNTVISKLTDFNIAKGSEYEILDYGNFSNCFFIKNDKGEIEEYTDEYFEMKI